MYWTDFILGTIRRANLDGSLVENLVTLPPGTFGPFGIALALPPAGCFKLINEDVVCHPDGETFTYTASGVEGCTGATLEVSITASGGAIGEPMCATVIIQDASGGFCCTTELCVEVPSMGRNVAARSPGVTLGASLRVKGVVHTSCTQRPRLPTASSLAIRLRASLDMAAESSW